MHFELRTRLSGGLKIIPEILDFRVCQLEGLNGVGKTAAVRLLEIATGNQPYEGSVPQWRALKASLGAATVSVQSLAGASTLDLVLTPTSWPDFPTTDLDSLGYAPIDGRRTSLTEARTLLSVTRISGDETLLGHFRGQVEDLGERVTNAAAILEERWSSAKSLLNQLAEEVETIESVDIESSYLNRETLRLRHHDLREKRRAAADQVGRIKELEDAESLMKRVQARLPDLNAQMASLEAELRDVEGQHRSLQDELNAQIRKQLQAEQLADALERSQRNLHRATTDGLEATTTLIKLLESLTLEENALGPELNRLDQRRADVGREKDDLDLLPRMIRLIDRVREPLLDESFSALREETLAEVEGKGITSRLLGEGPDSRRGELTIGDTFDRLLELDRQISTLEGRRKVVFRAQSSVDNRNRASRRVAKWQEGVNELEGQIALQESTDYQLRGRLRDTEESLGSLIRQRVELQTAISELSVFGSEEDLQTRVDLIRAEVSSGPSGATTFADAVATGEKASEELGVTAEQLAKVDQKIGEFESRVSNVVGRISTAQQFSWVRETLEGYLPQLGTDVRQAAALLTTLSAAIGQIRDQASEFDRAKGRITSSLSSVAWRIGSQSLEETALENSAIVSELGDRLASPLRNEHISEALFDGGEVLRVDLSALDVVWKTRSGDMRRRPLEAFSSGERAFSYTMASIRTLGEERRQAKNHLLVLDEFGAFMSGDRLRILQRFLDATVIEKQIADQVLVILPLRSELAPGSEKDYFERNSYFMRDGIE